MKRFGLSILVSLCIVALPACAGVTVPILDCAGLPCFDVSLGAAGHLKLSLDFRSQQSYLTKLAVKRLKLTKRPLAGATLPAYFETTEYPVSVGTVDMGRHAFYVVDPASQSSTASVTHDSVRVRDGAIAPDLLAHLVVKLDLASHRLELNGSSNEYCPGECATLHHGKSGDFGPTTLIAEGFSLRGQPLHAMVDTLFDNAVVLSYRSQSPLFVDNYPARRGPIFAFDGDQLHLAGTGDLRFGSISLTHSAPVFASEYSGGIGTDYNAAIGLGVLRLGIFNFDFIHSRLWLTRLPGRTFDPTPK